MSNIVNYFKRKYNLCTTDEIIEELLNNNNDELCYSLLTSSETSSEEIEKWYFKIKTMMNKNRQSYFLDAITSNPNCPINVLDNIFDLIIRVNHSNDIDENNSKIIYNILKSPNISEVLFRKIFRLFDNYNFDSDYKNKIYEIILSNPLLTSSDLKKYYNENLPSIWYEDVFVLDKYSYILSNPNCSLDLLKSVFEKFKDSGARELFEIICNNPNCPQQILEYIYKYNNMIHAVLNSNFPMDNLPSVVRNDKYLPFIETIDAEKMLKIFSISSIRDRKDMLESRILSGNLLEAIYNNNKSKGFSERLSINEIISLAKNPNITSSLLTELYHYQCSDYSYHQELLQAILKNHKCPEEILKSEYENQTYSNIIISNPNCPIEILINYFKNNLHTQIVIFEAILKNNHLSLSVLIANYDLFIDFLKYFKDVYIDNQFTLEVLLKNKIYYLLNTEKNPDLLTDENMQILNNYFSLNIDRTDSNLEKKQKAKEIKEKAKSFLGLSKPYKEENQSNLDKEDTELKQSNNVQTRKMNEKSKNVNEIVESIKQLLPYYFGSENIIEKVKNLVDEYNKKVIEIRTKESKVELNFNQVSISDLYASLINDLNGILEMLNESKNRYQNSKIFLDYIEKSLLLLNGNEVNRSDDLLKDLFVIKEKVLPFLENDNYLEELKSIFMNEKDHIKEYLIGNIDELNYTSLEIFKNYIRSKLLIFIIKLDNQAKEKYDINKIKADIFSEIMNNFASAEDKHSMNLLKEINAIIESIELYGNTEDKEKLKSILNNFEYVKNYNIGDSLPDLFNELYKINIEIESRLSDIVTINIDDEPSEGIKL